MLFSRVTFSAACKSIALSVMLMASTTGFAAAQQTEQHLTLVGGSVGGGYYQAAAALAEYIGQEIPGISTTVTPGGGWANVDRLETGDADIAVIENVLATLAWRGESPNAKKYDFRMLAAFRGPSIVQAFIPEDRGIESFEQIAEEQRPVRIATFERSQIVTPIALDILAEYGITEEKLSSWGGRLIFTSLSEGFRMINDGVADMWLTGGSFFPHHAAIELGTKQPFRLLPISEEVATTVAEKYGAKVGEVPAGIYEEANGTNEPYHSPMLVVAFAVRTDLDEDLVYKIKDALWKHREEFWSMHDQHKVYDIDFAAQNVGQAPLHPGAERWYAEHDAE